MALPWVPQASWGMKLSAQWIEGLWTPLRCFFSKLWPFERHVAHLKWSAQKQGTFIAAPTNSGTCPLVGHMKCRALIFTSGNLSPSPTTPSHLFSSYCQENYCWFGSVWFFQSQSFWDPSKPLDNLSYFKSKSS